MRIPLPDPLFRVYEVPMPDGYPYAWHAEIKHLVREHASHRCLRCLHPYEKGMGRWSPCDERCAHGMPARCAAYPFESLGSETKTGALIREAGEQGVERVIEAEWRILTVHHLNNVKLDCRWWNLAALCQRCHLQIQGKVIMDRAFIREHSEWFKPHAAGWYALKYEGRDITQEEALERMDELLAYEFSAPSLF